MAYDDFETSVADGEPVELYRFALGATEWHYTSCNEMVSYSGHIYAPAAISRTQISQSREDNTGGLEVTVHRNNPVAALFDAYLPVAPVALTIYRMHRPDANYITAWLGQVVSVSVRGAEARLSCLPTSQLLRRTVPRNLYQAQCTHALYDTGCGLDSADYDFAGPVSAVSGALVTVTGADGQPDGYYTHGWIVRDATGEIRWIVDHDGEDLTLISALDLTPPETVTIYAGCDRLEATCRDKFGNLDNFGGFSRVPWRNPFRQGVV